MLAQLPVLRPFGKIMAFPLVILLVLIGKFCQMSIIKYVFCVSNQIYEDVLKCLNVFQREILTIEFKTKRSPLSYKTPACMHYTNMTVIRINHIAL